MANPKYASASALKLVKPFAYAGLSYKAILNMLWAVDSRPIAG